MQGRAEEVLICQLQNKGLQLLTAQEGFAKAALKTLNLMITLS